MSYYVHPDAVRSMDNTRAHKSQKYIVKLSREEGEVPLPAVDSPPTDYSDITDLSAFQSTLDARLETKKLCRSQQSQTGNKCCTICHLPKCSKRSRLVYSRFLCLCDIDVVVEGETDAAHNKTRYGVDAVLATRPMSIVDPSEDASMPERLNHLLSLLPLPEIDYDTAHESSSRTILTSGGIQSPGTEAKHSPGLSKSETAMVSSDLNMSTCSANQNNSAVFPCVENRDGCHYPALDCTSISAPNNLHQHALVSIPTETDSTLDIPSLVNEVNEAATCYSERSPTTILCQHSPVVIQSSTPCDRPALCSPSYIWSEFKSLENIDKFIVVGLQEDIITEENSMSSLSNPSIDIGSSKLGNLLGLPGRKSAQGNLERVKKRSPAKSKSFLRQDLLSKFNLYQDYIRPLRKKQYKINRNLSNLSFIRYWHERKYMNTNIFKSLQPLNNQGPLEEKSAPKKRSQPIYFKMPTSCHKRCPVTDDVSHGNAISGEIADCPGPNSATLSPSLVLTERNNSNDAAPSHTDSGPKPRQYCGKVVRVEGDGRCLFRSLATDLTPHLQESRRDDFGRPERKEEADEETSRADELRASVVHLMKDNLHFYSQLESGVINADQPMPLNYQKFLDRLEAMSKHNTMPGDLELNAAAMVLERQILVLNTDLRKITVYGQDRYPESVPLAVRYTKLCADVGHYDAVVLDRGCGGHRHTGSPAWPDTGSLSLPCQDFSRLTIRDTGRNRSPGAGTGAQRSRRSSPGSRALPRKELLFNRHAYTSSIISDPVFNTPERPALDACVHNVSGRSPVKRRSSPGQKSSTNGRVVTRLPSALTRRVACSSCERCPVLSRYQCGWDKSTQTFSTEELECGTTNTIVEKSEAHGPHHFQQCHGYQCHTLAWEERLGSEVNRGHQNINENSKSSGGKKRRTQTQRYQETRSRKRKCNRPYYHQKKAGPPTPNKSQREESRNLLVNGGNAVSTDNQERCYKRKAVSERRNAKKRRLSQPGSPDQGVKPPPPRLPEAFSIGQCRCLLCRKKVVSSVHSWLKCYLCGRVAHRECVMKDSPSHQRGADDDSDIYFLCRTCVPV